MVVLAVLLRNIAQPWAVLPNLLFDFLDESGRQSPCYGSVNVEEGAKQHDIVVLIGERSLEIGNRAKVA